MALAKRSFHDSVNLDGSGDSRFPTGGKPQVSSGSLDINQAMFAAANISLTNLPANSAVSLNYRQYLTGTSAATATLSVASTLGALGNWMTSGNNLTNPATASGSGSLQVRAQDASGNTAVFPVQSWSILSVVQQNRKKHNPGHGMGGVTVLSQNSPASNVFFECDNLNGHSGAGWYRLLCTWSHIDKGPVSFTGSASGASTIGLTTSLANGTYVFFFSNLQYRVATVVSGTAAWTGALNTGSILSARVYDFQQIDILENRLKTQYDKPKGLAICVLPGSFGSTHAGSTDYSVIPAYIQTNSACGQATYLTQGTGGASDTLNSPVSQYGWSGGYVTNTYTAHLYNATVNTAWTQLYQAIAWYKDADPFFYMIWHQEDAWIINGSSNNRDPGYSGSNWLTQANLFINAVKTAFVQTPFQYQNTWLDNPTSGQTFENTMMSLGIMAGSADTYGAVKIAAAAGSLKSDGLDAYQGRNVAGSTVPVTDHRGVVPCCMDIEGPDLGAFGFGTRFTNSPADALAALNNSYKATYAAWAVLFANSNAPAASLWSNLAPFLDANPLTQTAYPSSAPGW